jgi:hypothetical protein
MSARQGQLALTVLSNSGRTGTDKLRQCPETSKFDGYAEVAWAKNGCANSQKMSAPERKQVIRLLENVLTNLL